MLQKQYQKGDILIKLTSVQMLHTKLNFTARGWFTLDMTVLHMVRGTLTEKKLINSLFLVRQCNYNIYGNTNATGEKFY